jgi:cell wall assembly regulator SMI1
VVHAGVELTDVSVPQTVYDPGATPLGGAVGDVELVHLAPVPDGAELVAQLMVLPKDQDTCLWYAEHELFGVNE